MIASPSLFARSPEASEQKERGEIGGRVVASQLSLRPGQARRKRCLCQGTAKRAAGRAARSLLAETQLTWQFILLPRPMHGLSGLAASERPFERRARVSGNQTQQPASQRTVKSAIYPSCWLPAVFHANDGIVVAARKEEGRGLKEDLKSEI